MTPVVKLLRLTVRGWATSGATAGFLEADSQNRSTREVAAVSAAADEDSVT